MNQQVQILDGYVFSESKKALKIELVAAGQMLCCYLQGAEEKGLIDLYTLYQFEIEELIEQQVERDNINEQGELWLTVDMLNI
jgi:hypothetical protein